MFATPNEPRALFLSRARIRSRRALSRCARTVFILQRDAFPRPLGPLDLARALARPCSPGMTEEDWHSLPRLLRRRVSDQIGKALVDLRALRPDRGVEAGWQAGLELLGGKPGYS